MFVECVTNPIASVAVNMNNWHCSLSAIQAPSGKSRRRFFIPPPRKIIPVPWNNADEMMRQIGFIPGEWKLSTNQQGHLLGLPHKIGVIIARHASRALFWFGGNNVMVINGSNFVGHNEEV
jgi:hypothetical protein